MFCLTRPGNRMPLSLCSKLIACALLSLALPTARAAEPAAEYPSKPVRIIIPFSPGGGADNLARTLQPALTSALGQPLVLDNRPGASSIIGTELAARSAPDGYTLLLITTTHTVNPSLIRKLPYDSVKDFTAVSLPATQPNILVVHPSLPARSLKEFVALGRAKAGSLTYASGGNGSQPHLAGELLQTIAGIELIHVPYKGSGPGVTALLGGQVAMMFVGPLSIEAHVKAGKLRALAVADTKRSAVLPDVPTVAEVGFRGLETGTWFGFLAPAGTPRLVVDTFHAAVLNSMSTPEMKSRLLAQGVEIVGAGPREFERTIGEEIAKWTKLVKRAGIAAE
jgi:tripartite-type tricarboxylate transporter receptor subunit TctC